MAPKACSIYQCKAVVCWLWVCSSTNRQHRLARSLTTAPSSSKPIRDCTASLFLSVLTTITPRWTPIENNDPKKTGMPEDYDTAKQWQGKKVVLISVPGAFSPGCQGVHIPPFVEKLEEMKAKGADIVAVIGYNDAWVMNAWGKVNGVKPGSNLHFLADTKTMYAKQIGWMIEPTTRNARWAMIIEKDGNISYAEVENTPKDVTVGLFLPLCWLFVNFADPLLRFRASTPSSPSCKRIADVLLFQGRG